MKVIELSERTSGVKMLNNDISVKYNSLQMFKQIITSKCIPPTSLSISKNAECPPMARCFEYFDEILDPFSSCMLMELLEQTVKNQKIAL